MLNIKQQGTKMENNENKQEQEDGQVVAMPRTEIIMTDEFKEAFRLANETNDNLFVTGSAGTGKSTWLKYLVQNCKKKKVILASTGIAAVNISNKNMKAQTIHSFFGLPPAPLSYGNLPKPTLEKRMVMANLEMIILEECSMIRVDVLWAIHTMLKENRNDNTPFGGVQIILVGDLCQLPPVLNRAADRELILHRWSSEFFFSEKVFEDNPLKVISFTKVFRQSDQRFLDILQRMKTDKTTKEDLDVLNQQIVDKIDVSEVVTLCTKNDMADAINMSQLEKIDSPPLVFEATVEGTFNKKAVPVAEVITLKIGCKVMLRVNIKEYDIYNGMTGKLVDVYEDEMTGEGYLKIVSGGREIMLPRKKFESVDYTYDKEKKNIGSRIVGSFTQFPVSLAYATSIHKAQGLTMDKVNINLGKNAFASGQTYVAISRCKSIQGLNFLRPIRRDDIFLDSRVKEFMKWD